MKKRKRVLTEADWLLWGKFEKIMKLTTILLLATTMMVSASVYSQKTKLSLNFSEISYQDVFQEIENQSEFRFAYSSSKLDPKQKVEVSVKNTSLEDILNKILPEGVTYEIINRYVVITDVNLQNTGNKTTQQRTISGLVSDEFGQPLPGVTIVIKGTTQGTVTNADGKYSINNVSEGATLQFSFVGMKTQEVVIASQQTINIVMESDAIGIEEVVAIGYGTIKKKDLTGSAVRADLSSVTESSNISIMESLQGKVAGLNVGPVVGSGAGPGFSVRGISTLSTSGEANAPLIVLDGIIYTGSIVDLNTADIESVDVLKDVSSSAIYGTQGANGVILITTKGGAQKNSKPVINVSSTFTLQNPSNKLTPMKKEEYEEFYPDIFWDRGGRLAPDYLQVNPDYSWQNNFKTLEIAEGYANGTDYPWWDSFTSTGQLQTHNVSLNGKNENIQYFVSGGFTDQKGFLKNDDYSKYNFRINIDAKVNDWLSVGTQTFATISDYSGVDAGTEVPFALQPWAPAKGEDGEYLSQPEGGWLNPYLTIQQKNSDIRNNFFSTLYAKIKLPLEGLTFETKYSNNYRRRDYSVFNPNAYNFQGAASKSHGIFRSWTFDNILNYTHTFNNDHNVNVTLLYGSEEQTSTNTEAASRNFAVDFLGYNKLEAGDPTLNSVNSDKSANSSLYQMGRLLYNYKNKYYLTATMRRDGFSGFGKNNKIATFPSFGLAWTLSEESFMNDIDGLDYLKLKGSYGKTGRRGIGPYATLAKVTSGPSMVFGDGGETFLGQSITSLANDNLRWETTTGLNVGADFEILNSRISGSFDYYKNETEDILFGIVLPYITGFSGINDNIAKVANHGVDITLSGKIIDKKDLKWTTTVTYSRARNEIVSIIGADNDGDGVEDDLVGNRLFIGEPQTVLYDYEVEGMWQLADKADGSIWPGFLPGTYKLKDISGPDGEPDGKISSLDDKRILGYTDPAYRVGVSNNVTYKNFNLYVFVNSIQGGKDRYYGNDAPNSLYLWNNAEQLSYSNVPSGAWDYWMPENPNAKYPRIDNRGSYPGTIYTQRNFIRLQDVTLSYTLPKSLVRKISSSNVKLFISGKNLLTITDWMGWDPETGAGFSPGQPLLRSYTMGLNVQF